MTERGVRETKNTLEPAPGNPAHGAFVYHIIMEFGRTGKGHEPGALLRHPLEWVGMNNDFEHPVYNFVSHQDGGYRGFDREWAGPKHGPSRRASGGRTTSQCSQSYTPNVKLDRAPLMICRTIARGSPVPRTRHDAVVNFSTSGDDAPHGQRMARYHIAMHMHAFMARCVPRPAPGPLALDQDRRYCCPGRVWVSRPLLGMRFRRFGRGCV